MPTPPSAKVRSTRLRRCLDTRVWLVAFLLSGRSLTIEDATSRYGIPRRTIIRHIDACERLGLRIDRGREPGAPGGRYVRYRCLGFDPDLFAELRRAPTALQLSP